MPRGAWFVNGLHIAGVRALRGLTQEGLAERAGIEDTTVKKAERANGPLQLTIISKLAKALEVSSADLYASIDLARIGARLTKRKWSRDDLAKHARLRPSDVRALEAGELVGAQIVKSVALALGCHPDAILSSSLSRGVSQAQANPVYRAALILGEQRAEPGIGDAIDQLLELRQHEQVDNLTAWGAVGLADLYSRKAMLVSPLKNCPDDLRLAHEYADEAIRVMPAAASYIKKGLLYTDDGKIAEAADCFQQAKTLDDDHTRLSPEYGTFLTATGRYDEAIACATEAIARDHERRSHSVNLGEIYYIAGKLDEATGHLERVEREYPDAWLAAALKGLIAISEGRWSLAQEHFDRAEGLPRLGRLRTVLRGAGKLLQAVADHRSIRSPNRTEMPGIRLVEYALFYIVCKRHNDCLSVLNSLVEYRYPGTSLMIHWPVLAPLQSDQRFLGWRRRWQPTVS